MRIKGIISGNECGEINDIHGEHDLFTKIMLHVSKDGQIIMDYIFKNAQQLDDMHRNTDDGTRVRFIRNRLKNAGWSRLRIIHAFTEIKNTLQEI